MRNKYSLIFPLLITILMSYLYLKYLPTNMESTLEVLKGIHFETLFTFLILAFIISYSVLVTVYNFNIDRNDFFYPSFRLLPF